MRHDVPVVLYSYTNLTTYEEFECAHNVLQCIVNAKSYCNDHCIHQLSLAP